MSTQESKNLSQGLKSGEFKLIDLDRVLGLTEGDLPMLKTIASMLADQIAEDLPILQLHCAHKDSASLVQSTHRLKGSLSYFGPGPAYEACVHLELLAQKNTVSEFDSGMIQLVRELNPLVQELARMASISI
jgi:HPt (histidine-containing phosphotransfer) domain-containing protein